MAEYSPTHDPVGYEFGTRTIVSGLLPNEQILASVEVMYVVRPNRWEWGCLAVSNQRLHFCGSKRLKTITATCELTNIQSPVFTEDIGVVQSPVIIFGEGSSFGFDCQGAYYKFLLMKRQSEHNERFVDTFLAAHKAAQASAQFLSEDQAGKVKPPVYAEIANRESKRKRVIFSIAAVVLLIAGVSVVNSRIRESRINDAILNASNEARLISDEFCTFVETQLAATTARSQSAYDTVYERYSKADGELRGIINDKYDIPSENSPYFWLRNPLDDCKDKAYERIAPTTTTAPRERSDAEIVAEGKTCAQQWRSAARETASGGSQDVQLRGTLYACDTFEDWVTEAFNNGEYSDYLLPVACADEPGAPQDICG